MSLLAKFIPVVVGLNLRSNYKQRYSYSGNLDLRFNRRKNGDEGFQDVKEDFWIDLVAYTGK